jgi:Excreted virulence factor EspC, type VII ESX diderm
MTSPDGIAVLPADLITHAAHVDAVAGDLVTARDAGTAVKLDAQAYGKLCVMVPMMLGRLQDIVIDGIDAAIGSLHDTGDRLRSAATGYQSADTRSEARHDGIRNAL